MDRACIRVAIVVAFAAGTLATAAHVPAATARAVDIRAFTYAPAVLTVPVATTVSWVNRDEEPHTVTSATGAFASGGLSKDDTFSQRFTRAGTYQYFCALHPHMKATVIVK
jgi:plastocyanin